ncbi:MAG: hypothetical protein M1825_006443 [Sarcosagium campestre]|nr:MAG: hypothetical protein M1825_006443 [Sarcosagium campestre]
MNVSGCIKQGRNPSSLQCLRRLILPHRSNLLTRSRRQLTFSTIPAALAYRKPPTSRIDEIAYHRVEEARRAYYHGRMKFAAKGMALSMLATLAIVYFADIPMEKNDAQPNNPLSGIERGTPIVTSSSDKADQIPTGTSTIPTFPRILSLPENDPSPSAAPSSSLLPAAPSGSSPGTQEYQLLGLGVRTVSFLGIQVYVVGIYIATNDIAALQQAMIRTVDPVATTLIKPEKDGLRATLLDPDRGVELWTQVLRDQAPHLRTAIRIVPTRNTDFQHLRDGWVRGITARAQAASRAGSPEFEDDAFGAAVQDFKAIFSGGARKSVPKGKTLLLMRGQTGALDVFYDDAGDNIDSGDDTAADGKVQGNAQRVQQAPLVKMGRVADERISRAVLMGYLAGKNVASESARTSIVNGVLDFVERPIGTVATQVV